MGTSFFTKAQTHMLSRREFLLALVALSSGCATGSPTTMPTPAAAHAPTPNTTREPSVAATATLDAPSAPTNATPTSVALSSTDQQFSGDVAFQHVFAQMEYIPRHTGTEGWRKCGDYILNQMADLGWVAEEQPFTYMDTACRNLIGKRGSGPLLILGAHYDSRKYADHDPNPEKREEPVPAANDGASGVAILLELARVLDPDALNRTIWLVAFDAEDNGNIDGWDWIAGSRHFVDVLTEVPQGMVLFDMIGDADQQIYYEHNSHKPMSEKIWQVADVMNYDTFIASYRHSMLDDHIPFKEAGIPAVDIIDFDYPYWHTTADTLDKVSIESLEAVGRTAQEWLLQGAPGMPPPPASNKLYLPYIAMRRANRMKRDRAIAQKHNALLARK